MGSCYDILRGNPQNTGGLDPGFLHQGIFQFTYNQGLTTADGRYSIPDYTTVNDAQSCSFSFSSRLDKDTASYMDSLKIHVDTSFKGWAASFSASADYQQVHEVTQSRQTLYISSQAQCEAYGASIDDAPFSDSFFKAVLYLPEVLNSSTKLDYLTFIQQYGTHIVTALKMGGRFGVRSEFAIANYSSLYSSGVNVKASAGYSGLVDINASLATDTQKKAAEKFNDLRNSHQMYQVGGNPPVNENGTAFEWAQTVKKKPLPLSYRLTELYKYLTSQYFPNITNINKKKENLQNVTLDYCMKHALDTSLCQKDFGPNKSEVIHVITSNQYISIPFITVWCWSHYQTDPNLRDLGTYMGTVNHTITGNTILVDSRKAPSKLITGPTGVINSGFFTFRYQCPNGYSTLTDGLNGAQVYQAGTHICVADHCLTNCTGIEIKTEFATYYLIGNGFTELGNSGSMETGSFFRDLEIKDKTPVDELFKCLTYECLSLF